MITVEEPQFEWDDVTLVRDAAVQRRKETETAPPQLAGWLSLGRPITRLVSANDADAQSSDRYTFHLVQLACSFRAPDGQPFKRAWVQVDLTGEPASREAPIAWSMAPMRQMRDKTVSKSLSITASFELAEVKAEHGTETPVEQVSLEALDLRTSSPSWELTRTSSVAISGSHLLSLIVRTPKGVVGSGRVRLSATVERWLFVRYQVPFPDTSAGKFTLK